MMKQGRNGQLIIIAILAVAILVMSVGFAAFAQNLTINGTVSVTPVKWSVHWDTASFSQAQNSVTVAHPTFTGTLLTFSASLTEPGDFAEFTIDAVNDGDFDAELKSIVLEDVSEYKYLEYTVTYGDHVFNATNNSISNVVLAKTNGREHVTVHVEYKLPANSADLPQGETPIDVSLSAVLSYAQAQ